MNRIIRISIISSISVVAVLGIWYFMFPKNGATQQLFLTEKISRNSIVKKITTSGNLKIKDTIKVGSLVSGTITDLKIEENESVKKGDLLAIIDNGKGESSLTITKGRLMSAHARYQAIHKKVARYQVLFEQGHISNEEFEEYERQLLEAKGALLSAQGEVSFAEREHANTRIIAPENGTIIRVDVKKGERITTDLKATVLCIIAPDLTQMEAELDIDESDMSSIDNNLTVEFTVDAHPNRTFHGQIKSVSYAPFYEKSNVFYNAKFDIDNSEHLFRPGMTIQATIAIANLTDTPTVSSHAFYIDAQAVKNVADKISAQYKPLSKTEKESFLKQHPGSARFVWTTTKKPRVFEEKGVIIGLSNQLHTQILSGMDHDEEYLIDVVEESEMDAFYKQMFRGGL